MFKFFFHFDIGIFYRSLTILSHLIPLCNATKCGKIQALDLVWVVPAGIKPKILTLQRAPCSAN